MTRRRVVEIDQEKCVGCGQCVPACAEGAIQIVGGKARLVSDVYCDGLGACLGHCPRDAITIVDRDAEPFLGPAPQEHGVAAAVRPTSPCQCPGASMQVFSLNVPPPAEHASRQPREPSSADGPPSLSHWPIQLHLISASAPVLKNADLLLVADCVPFACGDFHSRILRRRPVLIGCPKLDDGEAYVQKLAEISRHNALKSLTVVHMEVPCCTGLMRIAVEAVRRSGTTLAVAEITISRTGQILGDTR
jgi:Pyruvate/2-oxoacid:ferredoxin oxidoreductase delta subunit